MFRKAHSVPRPIGLDELRWKLAVGNVVVFYALPTDAYRAAHIPGALNAPPRLARRIAAIVVPDKSADIVVYGERTDSGAARQLADRLLLLGYANVRLFTGGIKEWMRFLLPVSSVDAA